MTTVDIEKNSNSEIIKIVLVQYGVKADALLYKNLKYLKTTFPTIPKVVLTNSIRNLDKNKMQGVEIYIDETLDISEIRHNISHPLNFRNGFWLNTIARFWLLSSYHSTCPNQSLLHIETDVLLMPSFPFKVLDVCKFDCIFSDVSEQASSAAVFYTRRSETSRQIMEHLRQGALKDSSATDMSLLAQYTGGEDHRLGKFKNGSGLDPVNGNVFRDFPIVDPATWGMFYLGRDPRNHRGARILYQPIPEHQIRAENFELVLTESGIEIEEFGELVSFHVHSKDTRYFSEDGLELLNTRIRNYSGKVKFEIDKRILVKLILTKIRKISSI
jgi:hypothetical protein